MHDQEIFLKGLSDQFKEKEDVFNLFFHFDGSLAFSFKGTDPKVNHCRITPLITNQITLYKMEFFKIQTKSLSAVLVNVYEPVYPNQLLTIFNKVSGL